MAIATSPPPAPRGPSLPRCIPLPPPLAASDPQDDGIEGDDLDDELDETGAVTNRSDGKSGTNTTAEPDPTKQPPGR